MPDASFARASRVQDETLHATTALRAALGYLNGEPTYRYETTVERLQSLTENEWRNLATYVRTLLHFVGDQLDESPIEIWHAIRQLHPEGVSRRDLAILVREVETDLSALAFFDRLRG